jgi:hypothetical protein
MPVLPRAFGALSFLFLVLLLPASASAQSVDDLRDQWFPRPDGARWVYQWSNSDYSPTVRREQYTIQSRAGTAFRLRWDELGAGPYDAPNRGTIDFRQTDAGLVNLTYQSTQPPPQFPVLCASAANCGNSVAGTMYMLIWGTRSPTLAEPLLRGTRWNSLGGADNDVASANRYLGHERVVVPAFPQGVRAAKVTSDITQAGALGDPFGSGVRTVWWVRGVGPVKILFRHSGGATSQSELASTSLVPRALPPDRNLLPLNRGDTMRYRWRNSRYMKRWSRQQFDVVQVVNNSARVDVKHMSGPINVAGSYTFATRLSGVTHLSGFTKAATRVKFPSLGPRGLPSDERRRFFTPFDLMVFGFGPVVPVYPHKGQTWRSSRDDRDWSVFGVTGRSRVMGRRSVKTPAGRFKAFVVKSTMRQRGYRFGSGTRTMWFAPNVGLVKLRFRHRDGSVSTVERLR